jgi:phosphatidylserine/phosphatidylglycerophosphate/cardiolipin synthase-like enzyme
VYEQFTNTSCAFFDYEIDHPRELVVDGETYRGVGTAVYTDGLMHNKFCVNASHVLTGSTNPTETGLHRNYNNIVVIKSRKVAANYQREFEELRSRGEEPTRTVRFNISGVLVEQYFCPEDDCETRVLDVLRGANASILFMTFSFTSDAIGDALVAKAERVRVEGVMESFGLNEFSEYEKLRAAGVSVLLERRAPMLHHKVFIIDGETVVTGSYNPTKAGTSMNDENVVILHDSALASYYTSEFERIAKHLKRSG